MPPPKTDEGLQRIMGPTGLAINVFNFTIGAGIFVLPAIIGTQLGVAGLLGYLLCGIMFAAIMLCYVEVATRIKTSGGSYAYVEAAFGPVAGFVVNWLFFFGWGVLSSAALMNIVADSLSVLFPVFTTWLARVALMTLLTGLVIFINVRGARSSVRFVGTMTLVKLLPLFAIVIFGFSHIQAEHLQWEGWPPVKAFGDTALVLFFAFAGFETVLSMSGEIRNPEKSVPRGILLGGFLIFLLYILLQLVVQGVLGDQMAEFKAAPLAEVARVIIGPVGATILVAAAALSSFSSVSGDILTSPRVLFAGANDGLFPSFLGKVHPRFATPYWAVITYGTMIFIFSISGGFKQLAILASGALLLIYASVVLAMIKLRRIPLSTEEKIFKVPGGWTIPAIALVTITWVFTHLSGPEMSSVGLFVVALLLLYFGMKKWKANRLATDIKS